MNAMNPNNDGTLSAAHVPTKPNPTPVPVPGKKVTKSKPRKRVNTAEKRHQHNAIERARRETLNSKFLSLAGLLPSLAKNKRPSKSAIVNGSISHLTTQRNQRLLAAKLLRNLCAEHDALLNEVNEWRSANGFAKKENAPAWNDDVEQICSVEQETFGNFTAFDGDDDDNDDNADQVSEQGSGFSAPIRPATANTAATSGLPTNGHASHDNSMRSPVDDKFATHQALFGNAPLPNRANNGLNWSTDFTNTMDLAQPFMSFLADNNDHSSSGSPSNSQQGAVVTPPTTGEINHVFAQTPSPRSTSQSMHGGQMNDMMKPVSAPATVPQTARGPTTALPMQQQPQTWAASQALFFQQQQAQLQRHVQNAQNDLLNDPHWSGRVQSNRGNVFPMTSPQPPTPSSQNNNPFDSSMFTQQLFASIFPQQAGTASHDQIEQWRKDALGISHSTPNAGQQMISGSPSVEEIRNAVRTGMGMGLGMSGIWSEGQQNAVEGF